LATTAVKQAAHWPGMGVIKGATCGRALACGKFTVTFRSTMDASAVQNVNRVASSRPPPGAGYETEAILRTMGWTAAVDRETGCPAAANAISSPISKLFMLFLPVYAATY
jgi:hypothetical protein